MTIMSDRWIRETATRLVMIEALVKSQHRDGAISFGISSYGDDARVANRSRYRAVAD